MWARCLGVFGFLRIGEFTAHTKSRAQGLTLETLCCYDLMGHHSPETKLHMTFLEDLKNDHKLWGMERLPKSGL